MDRRQYGLDFSSQEQERLALIRSLERVADRVVTAAGERLTYGRLLNVIELLERVSLLARDGVQAEISANWLGTRVTRRRSVSERTIRRWVADAKAVGLLETWERSHDFGGPNWNRFTIRMDRVRQLVAVTDRPAHEISWGADTGGHGRTRADIVSALGGHRVRPKKGQEKEKEEIPPPLPSPPSGNSPGESAEWVVVVEAIRSQGVTEAAKAVTAARANGCTPGHIRAVLQAYLDRLQSVPDGYGPGALKWRLQHASPALDAAAGWPPPRRSEQAARACVERQRSDLHHESELRRIVVAGRRAQAPEEQIRQRLRERLPEAVCIAAGW